MRYSGFYYSRDRFVDSRDFFKYCLDNPSYSVSVGVSEEDARKNLEFFKRFPSGWHSRLSAHNIEVYLIRDPTWVKFHIRKYVLVDGEQVWEKKEVIRVAFKSANDRKTPIKFDHLIFTEK